MILVAFISVLVKLVVFFVVLSVIIIVHELGHFLSAKKFGILCHEFSLGMGPAIYKKKKGETTYAIRCIPIGGFVSMAGELFSDDIIKPGDVIGINLEDGAVSEIILSEKNTAEIRGRIVRRNIYSKNGEPLEIELTDDYTTPIEELENIEGTIYPVLSNAFFVEGNRRVQIAPYNRCIESKPLWQRFITIFAGPFMNLVLAMIIYLGCAFASGTENNSSTKIGTVNEGYPAYGILNKGDIIKSVNGVDVKSWNEFSDVMDELALSGVTDLTIVLQDGSIKEIKPSIVINSIGLSSIAIKSDYKNITVAGAQVGRTVLRYKNDPSKKATQISNGDVITAINVYARGEEYSDSNWVEVTNWSVITNSLKDMDIANVYFRYYDCETNEYHDTYVDKQMVESYGNEVLRNQRIQKIDMFMGIDATKHHNFFESIELSIKNFKNDFTLIFRTLKLLIHPSGVRQVGVDNLSGVVGIYGMIGTYMRAGILALLLFMALLSVNIGVMNLLPIPALDGGRIVFILIEGITRKPLNRRIEAMINNIMFILLMLFMVYIAYNDIIRLAK